MYDRDLTERLMAAYDNGKLVAKHFRFRYLPEPARSIGEKYAEIAVELCALPDAEAAVALRKLLESRDAMLRAVD